MTFVPRNEFLDAVPSGPNPTLDQQADDFIASAEQSPAASSDPQCWRCAGSGVVRDSASDTGWDTCECQDDRSDR
jgi:hypothetical protein